MIFLYGDVPIIWKSSNIKLCLQIYKFLRLKRILNSWLKQNYLGDQIFYRNLDPPKKRRQ